MEFKSYYNWRQMSKEGKKRKMVSLTLSQINEITKIKDNLIPRYRNIDFQMISFVARLISNHSNFIFSDETHVFIFNPPKCVLSSKLIIGQYYQCTCQLKFMNDAHLPFILNMQEVDGNLLSIHFARVIKQQFEINMENSKKSQPQQIQTDIEQPNIQEICEKLKDWMKEKYEFTVQQLERYFKEANKGNEKLFQIVLTKLQDQELIANMGDSYRWMD